MPLVNIYTEAKILPRELSVRDNFGPILVPTASYFMLGDNRNDSKDSRFWKNTFVRFDQIVGKAVVRYYPSIKLLGYEEP